MFPAQFSVDQFSFALIRSSESQCVYSLNEMSFKQIGTKTFSYFPLNNAISPNETNIKFAGSPRYGFDPSPPVPKARITPLRHRTN